MPTPSGPGRTLGELLALLLAGAVWFFWGTGVGDFIGTEALRALVAREMIERDEYLIPTVHRRPYLRKPPLYAWTAAGMARIAGRFDEQMARWPSAAMGLIYLLTLYWTGRRWIDPNAGLAAAAIGGANWLVLEYGSRAELDAGLLAMTTLAIAAGGVAWLGPPGRRGAWFAVAYVAALAGSLWKAPHVLWMLWLSQIGLIATAPAGARREEARRRLLHPANLLGSVVCSAILVGYALLLSRAVGYGRVGRFAAGELAARLIPYRPEDWLGILTAPFELGLSTLPACAAAMLLVAPRPARSANDEAIARQGGWMQRTWRALSARLPDSLTALLSDLADFRVRVRVTHPDAVRLLLAWLIPNLLFLTIIPAKAPRYWFGVFGAIALLATLAWRAVPREPAGSRARHWFERLLRAALWLGIIGGAGLAAAAGVGALGRVSIESVQLSRGGVALCGLCGLLIVALSFGGVRLRGERFVRIGPWLLLTAMALIKPVQVLAVLPARAASQSLRPASEKIDTIVPAGRVIYVLSDRDDNDRSGELSDFGYYCRHALRWPLRAAEIPDLADGLDVFLLVRAPAREKLAKEFGPRLNVLADLAPLGKDVFLIYLAPHG